MKMYAETQQLETEITGQRWKDCAVCGKVRIPFDWNPPYCSECGGVRVNCLHCGTGRDWWILFESGYHCPNCKENPLGQSPSNATLNNLSEWFLESVQHPTRALHPHAGQKWMKRYQACFEELERERKQNAKPRHLSLMERVWRLFHGG